MFKKALLSSLTSVFLTLSILTVATAFGAPTENPPSGLTSPTFGGLTVNGTSAFFGNVQIGDHLTPSSLTVTNGIDLYADLNMKGGGSDVYTNSLYVTGTIMNVALGDPYPVNVSDDLTTAGKIISNNGLDVNTAILNAKAGLAVTGNTTVSGTTTSTGKITANGGLDVNTATLNAKAGLAVTGNTTVSGTTTSTGKITANGGLDVTGNTTVTGTTTSTGRINANGGVYVPASKSFNVDSFATMSNGLLVGGAANFSSSLYADSLSSTTLSVDGDSTFGSLNASSIDATKITADAIGTFKQRYSLSTAGVSGYTRTCATNEILLGCFSTVTGSPVTNGAPLYDSYVSLYGGPDANSNFNGCTASLFKNYSTTATASVQLYLALYCFNPTL